MSSRSFAIVAFRCLQRVGSTMLATFVTRPRRRKHIQSTLSNLQLVVTAATFLAGVQAQTMSFSDGKSIPVSKVTNVVSFVGLVFDIVGAISSLIYSILLRNALQAVDDHLEDLKHLSSDKLRQCYNQRTLTVFFSRSNCRKDLMWETVRSLSEHLETVNIGRQDSATDPSGLACLPTLQKSTRRIEILCMAGEGATLVMLFGAMLLLVSVLCLASATQSPIIWITILGLCITFALFHGWLICWTLLSEFRDEVAEEAVIGYVRDVTVLHQSTSSNSMFKTFNCNIQ